jgi:hypothetical protein
MVVNIVDVGWATSKSGCLPISGFCSAFISSVGNNNLQLTVCLSAHVCKNLILNFERTFLKQKAYSFFDDLSAGLVRSIYKFPSILSYLLYAVSYFNTYLWRGPYCIFKAVLSWDLY